MQKAQFRISVSHNSIESIIYSVAMQDAFHDNTKYTILKTNMQLKKYTIQLNKAGNVYLLASFRSYKIGWDKADRMLFSKKDSTYS